MVETRNSFLWMAILFTLMLVCSAFSDHKIIWVLWEGSAVRGIVFPQPRFYVADVLSDTQAQRPCAATNQFLWVACFYSVLPCLLPLRPQVVWLYSSEPDVAYILGGVASIHVACFSSIRGRARSAKIVDNPCLHLRICRDLADVRHRVTFFHRRHAADV